MKRQWKILFAAAMTAVLLLTAACGGDEEESGAEKPTQYVFGEETVDVVVPAADARCVIEETEGQTVYTYEPLSLPGGAARLYYDMILKPETGFSLVDEQGYITKDMPDFTQPEGMAQYAREAGKQGRKLMLRTEWREKTCTVVLEMAEGNVTEPPTGGMTLDEAMDFFCSLVPSQLGLEGDTMDEYEVYASGGAVFVQGVLCQKFQVYSRENPEQTNHLVAIYLMNGDATRLYQVMDDNSVKAIW